jgi:hypothetical protein
MAPSTAIVSPVIQPDRGEIRNAMRSAISSGVPGRPSGCVDFDRSMSLGLAKVWFAASDADGRYGPARALDLTILDDVPSAPLVVSLSWPPCSRLTRARERAHARDVETLTTARAARPVTRPERRRGR